jgi:ketosteroid isomerase-like protein
MSHQNVEVVRSLFEAHARRDLETIRALYAPDIEWDDVSGLWGDWGARRGRGDVEDAFASWFEAFEDVTFTGEAFLDAGEHVVVTVRIRGRGRGSGLPVDQRITLVWTVAGGRATRVRGYRDRREALEALRLSE